MAAEVLTVPRVYLRDKQFWQSAHHRAYCTDRKNAVYPGEDPPLLCLEFLFGIARNVPQVLYDAFAAAGIATTERPRLRHEDE